MNSLPKDTFKNLLLTLIVLLLCVACGSESAPEIPPDFPSGQSDLAATAVATPTSRAIVTATDMPMPTVTATVSTESELPTAPPQFSLCQGGDLSTETPFPPELSERIDPIISQLQARSAQASVSVAVQCGSGQLFVQAYGDASIEADVPAQPGTVYSLASLTKQYTAAAVLQLVEQGRVELDAPIATYLPDWTVGADTITVRDLLNHTSGVFSYTRLYGSNADLSAETTPDAVIDLFKTQPLDFQPGSQFGYSDSGYFLLGKLIEEVTGQTYPDYLRQNVLTPAGLNDTVYCVPTPAGIAQPYEMRGSLQPVDLINFSHAYSAGGLCGTASDVVRWQKALHSGQIIAPESLVQMTTSGTVDNGNPTGYGFGLFVQNDNGHRLLGHNGVAPGFSAWSSYYPDDDLSIVLLANTVPGAFLLEETTSSIAQSLFTIP